MGGFLYKILILCLGGVILLTFSGFSLDQELDEKVQSFLESHRFGWRDMNVPEIDGRILYNIILENNYTQALEIGTSTGHSAIWIAWALSKTGGKLVTIEIDERRYKEALNNFEQAGLSEYIDAQLADAHELVPELEGPFDFVFIDADKGWYTNYAKAVIPKMKSGGCIAGHNVYQPSRSRWARQTGTSEFYEFMLEQEEFETSILEESQAGVSVSYKKK
ncbi:MAG: methyltransferase [Candidatus Aminicenantes bacterium]|nr:methyltransferase [Candidatus Aminicenantes bacterium]